MKKEIKKGEQWRKGYQVGFEEGRLAELEESVKGEIQIVKNTLDKVHYEAYNQGIKDAHLKKPMGVSQWREYGELFGYWKYFEEQIAKAFGGCKECYGKGYATTLDFASGHGESDIGLGDVEIFEKMPLMRFCTCERGKQLKRIIKDNKI